MKEYQAKIKDVKANHKKHKMKNNEIIPKYNKDDMAQRIEYETFNKMSHAIRVTTQIENMSGNILVNLDGQSNLMKNGIKKVGTINEELDVSKTYLTKMINKENSDKKIILFVGFILFMIIFFVLIYRLYKKFNFQN